MKLTLSVIKADIGSIGGHVAPSKRLRETVETYIRERAPGLLLDFYISHTGDDIAVLMTHTRGEGDEQIHKLAWDAFLAGTKAAREEGLYGAGQDLLLSLSYSSLPTKRTQAPTTSRCTWPSRM